MAVGRHPHKYEEMLPEEVWAEMERAPVVYLPIGGLENHGPHNALGMDALRPHHACLLAAEIAGGVVHPPLYVAIAGHPGWSRTQLRNAGRRAFPPSVFVSREVAAMLYEELLETFADLGFRACVAYGGHGPCASELVQIAERLGHRVGEMRIWAGGEGAFGLEQVRDDDTGRRYMDHGGRYETSMLMAVGEHLVDLDRFWQVCAGGVDHERWQLSDEHNLERARVELGERYMSCIGQELARIATGLLQEV